MTYSSGTLDLSLLSLHWATLHVLPSILRPGPLCCPELSSQPWHWAALERASQVPEEDPTRPGVEKPGSRRHRRGQSLHRRQAAPPHPQLCSQARVLGEAAKSTHTPNPVTPRAPGRHSTSWLPKASALLAQRLRNPRGFPRPGVTTAAAARASRAAHPSRPTLGTRGQAPHWVVASPAPWAPRSPALAPRHPAPSLRAALGDSLTCAGAEAAATPSPGAAAQGEEGSTGLLAQWPPGAWCSGAADPPRDINNII